MDFRSIPQTRTVSVAVRFRLRVTRPCVPSGCASDRCLCASGSVSTAVPKPRAVWCVRLSLGLRCAAAPVLKPRAVWCVRLSLGLRCTSVLFAVLFAGGLAGAALETWFWCCLLRQCRMLPCSPPRRTGYLLPPSALDLPLPPKLVPEARRVGAGVRPSCGNAAVCGCVLRIPTTWICPRELCLWVESVVIATSISRKK